MGLTFLVTGFLSGTEMWLAPTAAFSASPFRWLRWLSESRATLTAAPNFAYSVLGRYSRRISDVDLGALRFAINGGEPVDSDGYLLFLTELARFGLDPHCAAPSYGLAEASCAVTLPVPGTGLLLDETVDPATDSTRRHALVGEPIPGMELRIVPTDDGLGDDGVGEIEIRGSSMMTGYLGQPALAPGDWFPTGDLGYLTDPDGRSAGQGGPAAPWAQRHCRTRAPGSARGRRGQGHRGQAGRGGALGVYAHLRRRRLSGR